MISEAVGGRRTVRGFLHGPCNNETGRIWDAELGEQLRSLALLFSVKRQRGQTPRMPITTTAGEAFLLGPGGGLEMARPEIRHARTATGETFQVAAGSVAMARQVLEGKKRKHPGIDVEATLASAEIRHTYAQGAVHLDLGFGGEMSGRSLVKSALALAHEAGIPTEKCGDALNYLRGANGEPCFGFYYVDDLIAARPAGVPFHCVAVEATPASGLILGYVEFFGLHRAVVCLGRRYTGKAARRVYALDPRSGTELKLSVRLNFDETAVAAIYNCERDETAGREAAFASVFEPVLQAQREKERDRAIREAIRYAWDNCGAVPDTLLTVADFDVMRRLFADRMAPWLQHATGCTEESAHRQAIAFFVQVQRNLLSRHARPSGKPFSDESIGPT